MGWDKKDIHKFCADWFVIQVIHVTKGYKRGEGHYVIGLPQLNIQKRLYNVKTIKEAKVEAIKFIEGMLRKSLKVITKYKKESKNKPK